MRNLLGNLYNINPNIEVIGTYTTAKKNYIDVKCKVCGGEWVKRLINN